jgi:hypothetical protein
VKEKKKMKGEKEKKEEKWRVGRCLGFKLTSNVRLGKEKKTLNLSSSKNGLNDLIPQLVH